MPATRLDVRLGDDHRRKLHEIAERRGLSISDVVRQMIEEAYVEIDRAMRLRAAEALGRMQIEDVPDPETLKKQLNETYDVPNIC